MASPQHRLSASDSQMVCELDREAVERAAEYGEFEGDIQRHKSQSSVLPATSDDGRSDTPESQAEIDYGYLEWTTPLEGLSRSPGQLPAAVTAVTDPFRWGETRKNVTLALCCSSTFVAAYTAGAYTSGLEQMEHEWGIGRVPLLVGVTSYTAGFSIAPMFLAPLSEVGGSLHFRLFPRTQARKQVLTDGHMEGLRPKKSVSGFVHPFHRYVVSREFRNSTLPLPRSHGMADIPRKCAPWLARSVTTTPECWWPARSSAWEVALSRPSAAASSRTSTMPNFGDSPWLASRRRPCLARGRVR